MTKEQKLEAYSMRLDGATFQQIADKFGVTKQFIQQSLFPSDNRKVRASNGSMCIYAGLAQFIDDYHVTQRKLGELLGIKCVESSTTRVRKRLTGKTPFTINEIYKILEFTGMTFEECFALKEDKKHEKI